MKIEIDDRILEHKKKYGLPAAIAFAEGQYHIPRGSWGRFNKAFREAMRAGQKSFSFIAKRKK